MSNVIPTDGLLNSAAGMPRETADLTAAEAPLNAQIHTAIWIERLGRHGEVLGRERCFNQTIHIGRGYRNDIVVDDPTVAEHHLRIERTADGHFHVEDLGSRNGLVVGSDKAVVRQAKVNGDQPLRIGATWLRLRAADHPVAAEQDIPVQRRIWPYVAGLVIAVVALELMDLWRGQSGAPTGNAQWLHQVSTLVMTFVGVLGWTSVWAIIGRIFTHHARYFEHLIIALGGLLAVGIGGDLLPLSAYALSFNRLPAYQFVFTALVLAAMAIFHLRLVTHTHRRLQIMIVSALAVLFVGLDVLKLQSPGAGRNTIYVINELAPPSVRLASGQSMDAFFASAQSLKAELDHARTDEQPEASDDEMSDEENDE